MRSISLGLALALLWIGQAFAAPLTIDIDKNVNLAIGTRSFGPFPIPDDLTVCSLRIDRTNWTNPAATVQASLSISVDGSPYVFWLGMTSEGAPVDTGIPNSVMTRALPNGINRKVQGSYVVAGARFRSTVSAACQ